jgi:hypothetical protein
MGPRVAPREAAFGVQSFARRSIREKPRAFNFTIVARVAVLRYYMGRDD